MSQLRMYTEKEFIELQKQVHKDLELTPDNVQEKLLKMPMLYTKYRKKYFDQRRLLKNINSDIKKTKKKRYHFYKFDYDHTLDNNTERALYVDGDDEMIQISMMYDEQLDIVNYLKDVITQIGNMSYNIRSYIDLQKLKNGVMT